MFFELADYWIFIVLLSLAYVALSMFLQANIGGKDKLKGLQAEMKELHKKMNEAAKRNDEKELNEIISKNWQITSQIMSVQMRMFAVIIVIFVGLMFVFPLIEPGAVDDIHLPLFDDGLSEHCDLVSSDGIYSTCYEFGNDGIKGAWAAEVHIYNEQNESLAKSGMPFYYENGLPKDLWLQNLSQGGLIDILFGKTAYKINASSSSQNVSAGQTVTIQASTKPPLEQGTRLEAVLNAGTFFFVDLPFAIPLLNISRIIGSYGFFILCAFALSMSFSILRAVYSKITKKGV